MPYIGNTTSDFSIDTGNITNRAVTATKLSPSSVGSNGQVLSVDGSGNLQWSADASGTSLTGSTNNTITTVTGANAIQGEANLTFNGTQLTIGSGSSSVDHYLNFSADTGTFTLKHNRGNHKLELSDSDGTGNILAIDTNGKVGIGTTSPSALLHVVGSDNTTTLLVESTDADANVGPIIELYRNSASAADNDALGRIDFRGTDDGGNASTFARIAVTALDITNNTEDARLDFTAVINDTFTPTMSITGGNVGIGTTTPAYPLDVAGDGGISTSATTNSTVGMLSIVGKNSSGGVSAISRLKSHPDGSSNQSHFSIETRNSSATMVEAMRITSDQKVGIGTTSPAANIEIINTTTAQIRTGYSAVKYSRIGRASNGTYEFFCEENGGELVFGTSESSDGGGVERMRINRYGKILIGHTTSHEVQGTKFRLQVSGIDFATTGISQQRFQDGASGPTLTFAHSRNASKGSHTILQNNDEYGKIRFYGSDGTDFGNYGAGIVAEVDGTPGPDDMPGRLILQTTSDSSSVASERVRIDSTGRVGINGAGTKGMLEVRASGGDPAQLTAVFGANEGTTNGTLTDNTDKACRIGIQNYDTDAKPFSFLVGSSTNGVNTLNIGGGTSLMNGATEIKFSTDVGQVNNGGTERLSISDTGIVNAALYYTAAAIPCFKARCSSINDKSFGQSHANTYWDINYLAPMPTWGANSTVTSVFNQGSHMTTVNWTPGAGGNQGGYIKFTAPVAGVYYFYIGAVQFKVVNNDWCGFGLMKNTTAESSGDLDAYLNTIDNLTGDWDYFQATGSTTLDLAKDDYVILYARSASQTTVWDRCEFGGHLLG